MLAAGRGARMGRAKLELELNGRTFIDRALDACIALPLAIVVSPELALALKARATERATTTIVVINARPELGMSHSLQLAQRALAAIDGTLAVVPADLPFLEARHVDLVFEHAQREDVDVTYPRRGDGTPGHPVVFGPRARAKIGELEAGDTIRRLRDDAELRRAILATDDDAFFFDVDTPQGLERARERDARSQYPRD